MLAVLPTVFRKSLVFQVFAVVRSLLSVESTSSNGSVLVVCPLKSIISDQIEEARSLGLTALEIEPPGILENLARLPDILFTLAETVCADGFRDVMRKRQRRSLHISYQHPTICQKLAAGMDCGAAILMSSATTQCRCPEGKVLA